MLFLYGLVALYGSYASIQTNPYEQIDNSTDLSVVKSVLAEDNALNIPIRTGYILEVTHTIDNPAVLRLLLDICVQGSFYMDLFKVPRQVTLSPDPLWNHYCAHKKHVCKLLGSGRFDLLKLFHEAGILHYYMFDSSEHELAVMTKLLENGLILPGLYRRAFEFAGDENSSPTDLEALYKAGLPSDLILMRRSRGNLNMLEYMLMKGKLESAYVAYKYGARLVKDVLGRHYYEEENGFVLLPEDFAKYIIRVEHVPKASLVLRFDEGCTLNGLPCEIMNEQIRPVLCRAVKQKGLDDLFTIRGPFEFHRNSPNHVH